MIDELLHDGAQRHGMIESDHFVRAVLSEQASERATEAIRADPTYRSYLVLMALRRDIPEAAIAIPPDTRADVLTSAMAELPFLNDFGYLDPSGGTDGPAGSALIETGGAARPGLAALLSDTRPAMLLGSEEATLSHLYGYRRCDFAYHFLALTMGRDPAFRADPAERDTLINDLLTLIDKP